MTTAPFSDIPARVPAADGGQPTAQPRGLYYLFATELWERFSYFGLRALLVLYMTKELLYAPSRAAAVYGWYTGLVYLSPIAGGWLADRRIGARRAVLAGAAVMCAGHAAMAAGLGTAALFLALGLVVAGNGLFKGSVATLVGNLYPPGDPRRDRGFTIFYVGINLGAMLAPLACGWLAHAYGWHWGFAAAGAGMALGIATFAAGRRHLRDAPAEHGHAAAAGEPEAVPGGRAALPLLFLLTVLFFASFEQAGSSMTLFAEARVDRTVPGLGWTVPTPYLLAVNPILVVLLGPLLAAAWAALERRGRAPGPYSKFAAGLALVGAGFVLLSSAAANPGRPVPLLLIVAVYLLHTLGELCVAPVGLSLISRIAPAGRTALFMGLWFSMIFVANVVGGYFAGLSGSLPPDVLFAIPGTACAAGAAALLLLIRLRPAAALRRETADR